MRRLLLLLLFLPAVALAGRTSEVLVSHTTPTRVPSTNLTGRRAILIENRGPNPIACGYSSTITYYTAHVVDAGARQEFPADTLWCIASTATQLANAATVVSEVQ